MSVVDLTHVDAATAATTEEARAVLAVLFPGGGRYLVKARGRVLDVTLSDGPARAADPLTIWQALFRVSGRYAVAGDGELAKAVRVRPLSTFEEHFLERLVEQAQEQYTSIRALVRRTVLQFLGEYGADLTDAAALERFERLLFDLRQGIRWSVANPVSQASATALRELGFAERELLDWPGIAYRLGLIDQQLRTPGARFSWPQVQRLAAEVPLTRSDEVAIAVARARAGQYLTPVLLRDGTLMHEAALERTREIVGSMTADAVAKEVHPQELASQLYRRFKAEGDSGPRDWLRVARSEIQEARLRGAFAGDKRARGWMPDTLLYKTLGADPCSGCLRLWKNPDGTPFVITLAQLEKEDALGPNRGPWREWHHRIGISHPQCLDSPALQYSPALASIFAQSAPRYRQMFIDRRIVAEGEAA